jgi:hypothetical protein
MESTRGLRAGRAHKGSTGVKHTSIVLGSCVSVAWLALACGEARVLTECTAADGVTPICGFENPEDLAPFPGGSWIVVSQFPGAAGGSGSLVAYRVADGRKLTLFPDPDSAPSDNSLWGATDCPGPPDPTRFGPHGIDVDLARHRLAVVNHGSREAVELFEMGHSPRGPAVVWRGCVPLPAGAWANDVALLPTGGFVVTHMMAASGLARFVSAVRLIAGLRTGNLLEWHAEKGWSEVPESGGQAPNGVAVSSDAREIYFSEWTGLRLVRLRKTESGMEREEIELAHHPDNITWTRDGLLLVTGQIGSIGEVLECGGTERGTCALPFSVVLVEPSTLDQTLVLEHPGTAQGAASVALEVGQEIFIGTFDGDRLARAPFMH